MLKTFRELSIARFELDKPVFLEKVFVLYADLHFAVLPGLEIFSR